MSSSPGGGEVHRRPLLAIVGALLVTLLVVVVVSIDRGAALEPGAGGGAAGTKAVVASPSQGAEAPPPVMATPAPATDGSGSSSVPGPETSLAHAVPPGSRPVRIAIPAIHVDASLTDLGIADDGSIEVPSQPAQAGWLDTTPAPGQQGPAVIAGHVDSETGPAVFYLLSTLKPGDAVLVSLRDGSTVRFTVDGVRTYQQDDFPTGEVYGPVPGPALRLVTCGGDYVKSDGGYQANVVVYAS